MGKDGIREEGRSLVSVKAMNDGRLGRIEDGSEKGGYEEGSAMVRSWVCFTGATRDWAFQWRPSQAGVVAAAAAAGAGAPKRQ